MFPLVGNAPTPTFQQNNLILGGTSSPQITFQKEFPTPPLDEGASRLNLERNGTLI